MSNPDPNDLTGRRIRDVLCGAAAVYRELATATVTVAVDSSSHSGSAANTEEAEEGPPKRKRLRTEEGSEKKSNLTIGGLGGCRCAPPPLLEMMFAMVASPKSPFLCIDCGDSNTQWCEEMSSRKGAVVKAPEQPIPPVTPRGAKAVMRPPKNSLRWCEDGKIFATEGPAVFAHRAIVRRTKWDRSILVVSQSRAEALRENTDLEIDALVRAYEVPWSSGYPALTVANRTTAADVSALIAPLTKAVESNSAAGLAFASACFDYIRHAVGPRKRFDWLRKVHDVSRSPMEKAAVSSELRALMSCPRARRDIFWDSPISICFFCDVAGLQNNARLLPNWCEAIAATILNGTLIASDLLMVLQHLVQTQQELSRGLFSTRAVVEVSYDIVQQNSDLKIISTGGRLAVCVQDWSSAQLIAFVNQVVQSYRRYCDETKEDKEEQQLGLFLSHLSVALASRPDATTTMQTIVAAAAKKAN